MDTFDFFAALALCASAASAIYARWAGKAAERANEIAMHNERLKIYKGLLEFRAVLATRGPGFPDEELWKFWDFVLLSEFYFSKKAHIAMKKLADDGNQIKAQYDLWHGMRESSGGLNLSRQTLDALHRSTRDECGAVADLLKSDLLLYANKPTWLI